MQEFIRSLSEAKYLVALTGAGMDTESKLPDFRGPSGMWRNYDPRVLASTDSLRNNYSLFQEFYAHRIRNLQSVSPHRGHEILADWEKRGFLKAIITQNVSGLHRAAGSENVYELHGNIRRIYCRSCSKEGEIEDFLDKKPCSCSGQLRPGVTLFGEMLPQDAYHGALGELEKADFLLIIGTSLEVYPAAGLAYLHAMKRCYIDLEARRTDGMDFVYREKIGGFLEKIEEELKGLTE